VNTGVLGNETAAQLIVESARHTLL
jgi:hypothetical protein